MEQVAYRCETDHDFDRIDIETRTRPAMQYVFSEQCNLRSFAYVSRVVSRVVGRVVGRVVSRVVSRIVGQVVIVL